ncbi:hypothetical protein BJV82DRAFT_624238 [Fennellomyces sp. T-0311]|nr:hypothetical protein BJV82DRAFT_624238 [Fennellomyces sp. T-0311]
MPAQGYEQVSVFLIQKIKTEQFSRGLLDQIRSNDDILNLLQTLPSTSAGQRSSSANEQANQIVDGDLDRRASMLPTTSSPTFAPLAPSDEYEPYDFDSKSPLWPQFVNGVFRDMVFTNAFPSVEDAGVLCHSLMQTIYGDSFDERRSVAPRLVNDYISVMGEHRTQLHNSVRYWLLGFGFAGHDAPVDIATRRTALINYLLVDMRFARLRYGTATTFLYSEAISDCIRSVLLTSRRTSRLSPLPETIPRQCITLIALMIYYRMIVCVQRNINQLTPEDIQLHRTGDEDMESDQDGICLDNRDQFGFDSSWEDSYNDFLDSNRTVGALINWESVETSITDDVGSTLRSGNRSGVNQLFRRFVAAELEHQQ